MSGATCRTPLPPYMSGMMQLIWVSFRNSRPGMALPAETLDFEHDSDQTVELEKFRWHVQFGGMRYC
jgi:hypothetical protein